MKINGKINIKKVDLFDLVDVIETVVSFVIRKESNTVIYRPYYKEIGMKIGIARNIIEGIEFEETDDILSEILNNKKLNEAINNFIAYQKDKVSFIYDNVDDIVEFKKQEYTTPDFTEIKEKILTSLELEENLKAKFLNLQSKSLEQQIKINEFQEKVIENMSPEEIIEINKRFLSEEYDANKVSEIVVKEYMKNVSKNKKKKQYQKPPYKKSYKKKINNNKYKQDINIVE